MIRPYDLLFSICARTTRADLEVQLMQQNHYDWVLSNDWNTLLGQQISQHTAMSMSKSALVQSIILKTIDGTAIIVPTLYWRSAFTARLNLKSILLEKGLSIFIIKLYYYSSVYLLKHETSNMRFVNHTEFCHGFFKWCAWLMVHHNWIIIRHARIHSVICFIVHRSFLWQFARTQNALL